MEFKETPFIESSPIRPFEDPLPAGGIMRTYKTGQFGDVTFICEPNQDIEARTVVNPYRIKAEITEESDLDLKKHTDVQLETILGNTALISKGEINVTDEPGRIKIIFDKWTTKHGAREPNPLIMERSKLSSFEVRLVDLSKTKKSA